MHLKVQIVAIKMFDLGKKLDMWEKRKDKCDRK